MNRRGGRALEARLKARENGKHYALLTAQNATAAVGAKARQVAR